MNTEPTIYIHPKSNINPISVEKFLEDSNVYDDKLLPINTTNYIKSNTNTDNINIRLRKHSLLKLEQLSDNTPLYYKNFIYNNISYREYYLFFIDGKWCRILIKHDPYMVYVNRWITNPFINSKLIFYIKNKKIFHVDNEKKYKEVVNYRKWNYKKINITSQYWFHFNGTWGDYKNKIKYNLIQIPPEYYIYVSNTQMIISIIILIITIILSSLCLR